MSYTIGELRRWDTNGLTTASSAVATRETAAEDARLTLSDGREALADGWEGLAADAVLDAADGEKGHVTKLADGLHDLADALARAEAALGPAVQTVRDRIAAAEAAGLEVGDTTVAPRPGRDDIEQTTVDLHAAAIRDAIDTVVSLDEHYGREVDTIAELLHSAIPAEVDRTPIPGPDDKWTGRTIDAMTGGTGEMVAREQAGLDPRNNGRHALQSLTPDEVGRLAKEYANLGRAAGGIGLGATAYSSFDEYRNGEASAGKALAGFGGAVVGGAAGGAVGGAIAGSFFGPVGTLIGAGIGAAVGSEVVHDAAQNVFEFATGEGDGKETDREG